MLALAWKEYRQIRLVALLLVAVLLAIYFVVGFTPWSDVRVALIPIGVGIIVSVSAALAFAEEKPSRTYLFLSALPLGHARRWFGKAGVNLLLTAATLILFVSLVCLLDRESFEELRGKVSFNAEELCVGASVLFTLWSAAVFYSSAFERSVVAMLFTWGTLGAVVYTVARVEHARFFSAYGVWPRSVAHSAFLVVIFSLLGVLCVTFLVSSLLLERKMPRRPRFVEKVAGVLATLAVAAGLSLLVTSLAIARSIRYVQQHPTPYDAETIHYLGVTPNDGSLLAMRGNGLYRCTPAPDWNQGRWRRYDVAQGQPLVEPGRGWVISGDGNTLAFVQHTAKRWDEIGGEILRNVFLDRHWDFLPLRGRLGLLDLETGAMVFPEALERRDLEVICASWQGDPPKLYCLVDKVRPDGHQRPGDFFYVIESHLLVFSERGELLETRDVPEVNAFRDRQRHLAWERPGASCDYFPYPRMEGGRLSIARYSSGWTGIGRRQLTRSGAVLVVDLEAGTTRQRVVEDPEEHIAFSATLDWELAFADSDLADWKVIPSRHTHRFWLNELDLASPRNGVPDVAPPPVTIGGPEARSIEVFGFSDGLEAAKVRYQFLKEDASFVAFVTEYASSQKPGFEHAHLENAGVWFRGAGQELFDWRRVRAIGIDLHTMQRSEIPLPPGIISLLVGPRQERLFFHNATYSALERRSYTSDCIVVQAPTLKRAATYRWPEGWGPAFGASNFAGAGTFLDNNTVASPVIGYHETDILIWTPGAGKPVPVTIPDIPAQSES